MKPLYVGMFFLTLTLTLTQFSAAQARERFSNNTGQVAYTIISTTSSDVRSKFKDKINRYHEDWHKEVKKIHQDMKKTTAQVKEEIKKDKPSAARIKNMLKSLQSKIEASTAKAVENTFTVTAEVLAEASLEERKEIVEKIEEAMEEWEEYIPNPPRWYQFWK